MKNKKPSSFEGEDSINKGEKSAEEEGGTNGFEEEHDFLPCSWANNVELRTFEGSVIKNQTLCGGEETKMVKENMQEKQR